MQSLQSIVPSSDLARALSESISSALSRNQKKKWCLDIGSRFLAHSLMALSTKKIVKQGSNRQSSQGNFFLAGEFELEGRCPVTKRLVVFYSVSKNSLRRDRINRVYLKPYTQFIVMFGWDSAVHSLYSCRSGVTIGILLTLLMLVKFTFRF
jgi:hypothetical protein